MQVEHSKATASELSAFTRLKAFFETSSPFDKLDRKTLILWAREVRQPGYKLSREQYNLLIGIEAQHNSGASDVRFRMMPPDQTGVDKQVRATRRRDLRLLARHRAGSHEMPAQNCPACRIEVLA